MKDDVLLAKPTTFMNNSGIAVKEIIEQYNLEMKDVIIVSDDFNLQEGSVRLRLKGSSGGHNGLSSVIYHLESDSFPRLRIGIGRDESKKDIDYVLGQFYDSDILKKIIDKSVESMETIVQFGTEKAMSRINRKEITDIENKTGGTLGEL